MNPELDSSLTLRVQLFSIISSLLLIAFVVYLIKKERLKEGYSIFWFFSALTLLILSVFTSLLYGLATLVGIYYVPAALFLVLIAGLILLLIHYSVVISKHENAIAALVQEIALLAAKLNKRNSRRSVKQSTKKAKS